ncbi:MAG: hypothetical protein JWO59_873 [Chloroflexi bacterium]|jgi:plastocyanin|nr:hypothetical protein [Chloroflexota bacterium]MDB5077140.1 hypothetical protein [Chloroflexota bacterium]
MRRRFLLGTVITGATLLLAGCGASGNSGSGQSGAATPTIVAANTPTSGCAPASTDGNGGPYPAASSSNCTGMKTVEVDVINDPKTTGAFSPSNITVSAGTTVKFVWKSSGHNLSPFHDGIEAEGYTFSKTFDKSGNYPYSCQVHPAQNGIVHVQ